MLVLRAFLGVTFTFAGLQKLANPNFFRTRAPGSFAAQVHGSIATSPLHHLLDPALHAPVLVALLISFGEIAVGLGTLCGLFGRVAAICGMLLSLTFFLTVSYNDAPYYYGADIVFLFAWTPLALTGSGRYSLDALYSARRRVAHEAYMSAAARSSKLVTRRAAEIERRVALQRFAATGVLGAFGAVLAGLAAGIGRLLASGQPAPSRTSAFGGTASTSSQRGSSAQSTPRSGVGTPTTAGEGSSTKGTRLGPADVVPVGGAASFTDPSQGTPAFVVQPSRGRFVAFSGICTHAGCQVQFDGGTESFFCPCHGSTFSATTGAVLNGPAQLPLPSIPVSIGPNDMLYVDG